MEVSLFVVPYESGFEGLGTGGPSSGRGTVGGGTVGGGDAGGCVAGWPEAALTSIVILMLPLGTASTTLVDGGDTASPSCPAGVSLAGGRAWLARRIMPPRFPGWGTDGCRLADDPETAGTRARAFRGLRNADARGGASPPASLSGGTTSNGPFPLGNDGRISPPGGSAGVRSASSPEPASNSTMPRVSSLRNRRNWIMIFSLICSTVRPLT